ncbi:MAG: ATP-grasp domain-containing protein [Ignavibacteria bacterium]|nr:ATP-grasp domain-containing protein [Ignavibacteria bacterium]
MAKKLRVAVLYNEPLGSVETSQKYVSENGLIQDGPPSATVRTKSDTLPPLKTPKTKRNPEPVQVDLSELGVVGEMEDIKEALVSLGYRTSIMNVDSELFRLIDYLRKEKPDLIFNLVECVENEAIQEMHVAGIYELLKIPYTGAGPLTLGTALNKPRVKEILSYYGIRTPKFQVFPVSEKIVLREDLTFPLIVKPSREDASVGIDDASVVYSVSELKKRVRYIFNEFDQPALVEEYIEGRELNIALVGNDKPLVLPISEIDFSGLTDDMHKIVSYEAKWVEGTVAYAGTQGVCPASLPPDLEEELKDIATRCYRIIGCRDYGRVDFRLTREGIPYVLEVNPNPDISDDAGFARSARSHGFTFPQVIGKIVDSALERL